MRLKLCSYKSDWKLQKTSRHQKDSRDSPHGSIKRICRIPHDLLIANLHAYGFNEKALTFLYSCLKLRKQSVKTNDTESIFQILLSGVPQESLLGPIPFNLSINDYSFSLKKLNFADNNTIYVSGKIWQNF